MQRGDVNQMSFAFRVVRNHWAIKGKREVRELLEVNLDSGDVSIVTYPAYPAAGATMRGAKANRWLPQYLKDHQERSRRLERMKPCL
jgi:HK97 family phage prohead protease